MDNTDVQGVTRLMFQPQQRLLSALSRNQVFRTRIIKQKIFTFSLKPLCAAFALTSLALSGCTNDTTGQTRVIETVDNPTDPGTDAAKTTYTTLLSTPANGAKVAIYDLKADTEVVSGTVSTKTPADPNAATNSEKGLSLSLTIDQDKAPTSSALLTVVSASDANTTYYDPAVRTANGYGDTLSFPADVYLMAISTNTTRLAQPSPLTTLATYRSLVRLGYSFDTLKMQLANNMLPSPTEIRTFLKGVNERDVIKEYNVALQEVFYSLNIIGVPSIDDTSEIKNFASDSAQSSNLNSWLIFLAHMQTYVTNANATGKVTSTPYLTFARDLAVDFFDGDIDGETINGITPAKAGHLTLPSQYITNTGENGSTYEDIYRSQFPVLSGYESVLESQFTEIGSAFSILDANSFKSRVNFLDTSDGPYFALDPSRTSNTAPTTQTSGAPISPSTNTTTSMVFNISQRNTSDTSTFTITRMTAGQDTSGNDVYTWTASPSLPTGYKLNDKSGLITLEDTIPEDSVIEVSAFTADGSSLGTLTTYAPNKPPVSYTDRITNVNAAFIGVGNKTYGFGLPTDVISKTSINADKTARGSNGALKDDTEALVGKYSGSDCSLTIESSGAVTLQQGSTSYTTLVDRETNDSIYRIANGFMLNVASPTADDQRRFIQVKIVNDVLTKASTAIVDTANAEELQNTDASCSLTS